MMAKAPVKQWQWSNHNNSEEISGTESSIDGAILLMLMEGLWGRTTLVYITY
jgi:hypothetical protein